MNRKLRQKIIAFIGLGMTAVIIAMFSMSHFQSNIENFSDLSDLSKYGYTGKPADPELSKRNGKMAIKTVR